MEQCLRVAVRITSGEAGRAQFYGSVEAGTYDHIMRMLGGYDETIHHDGHQDTSLIYRVRACEHAGTTIRVDINKMIGTTIDNTPGQVLSAIIKSGSQTRNQSDMLIWRLGACTR